MSDIFGSSSSFSSDEISSSDSDSSYSSSSSSSSSAFRDHKGAGKKKNDKKDNKKRVEDSDTDISSSSNDNAINTYVTAARKAVGGTKTNTVEIPSAKKGKKVIVWMDRNESNNPIVEKVRGRFSDVIVVQLGSPNDVYEFMLTNSEKLKEYKQDGSQLRFITNNSKGFDGAHRFAKSLYKLNGAFMTIRELRFKYGIMAPILIYCYDLEGVKLLISRENKVNATDRDTKALFYCRFRKNLFD